MDKMKDIKRIQTHSISSKNYTCEYCGEQISSDSGYCGSYTINSSYKYAYIHLSLL